MQTVSTPQGRTMAVTPSYLLASLQRGLCVCRQWVHWVCRLFPRGYNLTFLSHLRLDFVVASFWEPSNALDDAFQAEPRPFHAAISSFEHQVAKGLRIQVFTPRIEAKRSKAKQSEAKRSKAKQSEAKQSKAFFTEKETRHSRHSRHQCICAASHSPGFTA